MVTKFAKWRTFSYATLSYMVARDFFAFMNLYEFLYENCSNLKKI